MTRKGVPNKYVGKYMESTYIALQNARFDWTPDEVSRFEALWKHETSIEDMAKNLQRPSEEVIVLAIDRMKKGKITQRKRGLLG